MHPAVRVALHAFSIVGLALALFTPAESLRRAGVSRRILVVFTGFTLLCVLGAVPVPWSLGRVIAPGWARHPGLSDMMSWRSISWDSAAAGSAWSLFVLVASASALAAVAAPRPSRSRRRRRARLLDYMTPVRTGLYALVALVTVLVAAGLPGPIPEWGLEAPPARMFGPFVDANHVGAILLLAFPTLLLDSVRWSPPGLPLVLAAAVVAVTAYTGSTGPLVMMAAQGVAGLVVLQRRPILLLALPFVMGLAGAAALLYLEGSVDLTLHGRIPIWIASTHVLLDHWVFGTGLGTFGSAIEPYRFDTEFQTWSHAHNEVVEWVVETGLLGTVFLAGAILLFSIPLRHVRTKLAQSALMGVGGVLAYALVEFPLHIPAIAMAAAAVWSLTVTQHAAVTCTPWQVRGCLLVLLLASVVGVGFESLDTAVGIAEHRLEGPDAARAQRALERVDPSNRSLHLHRIRRARTVSKPAAVEAARAAVVQRPRDGSVLARAGTTLARAGEIEDGVRTLDAAVSMSPANWRIRVQRAVVLSEAHHPDLLNAWRDVVLNARAPRAARLYQRCWEAVPVGVFWADVAEDAQATIQRRIVQMLVQQEEWESALLILESPSVDPSLQASIEYATVLVRIGRLDAGRTVLEGIDGLQATIELARVCEIAEDWECAVTQWQQAIQESPYYRLDWYRALAMRDGPEAVLRKMQAALLEGTQEQPEERLLRAHLFAQIEKFGDCVTTLDDPMLARGRYRKKMRALRALCRRGRKPPAPPSAPEP